MMWIVWIVGGSALADKSQDAEKHLFALASCHDGWHHQPVWASFLLPQPCLLPPPSRADGSADAREALSVAIFSSEAAALCRMDRLETPRPNVQVHRDDPSKFFLQVPLASGTIDAVDRRAISDLTLCTAKLSQGRKARRGCFRSSGRAAKACPNSASRSLGCSSRSMGSVAQHLFARLVFAMTWLVCSWGLSTTGN